MKRLLDLARKLRAPGGCPWDQEQTFQSFRHCLVEEAREAVLAIERGDWENLEEELGDTLFNLVFLINLAEEQGHFTLEQVIAGSLEKMIRRHPHVFGDQPAATAEEAAARFYLAKAQEKQGAPVQEAARTSDKTPHAP